jgi:hypothetical protein
MLWQELSLDGKSGYPRLESCDRESCCNVVVVRRFPGKREVLCAFHVEQRRKANARGRRQQNKVQKR